jgi:hypothetical protein
MVLIIIIVIAATGVLGAGATGGVGSLLTAVVYRGARMTATMGVETSHRRLPLSCRRLPQSCRRLQLMKWRGGAMTSRGAVTNRGGMTARMTGVIPIGKWARVTNHSTTTRGVQAAEGVGFDRRGN